MKQFWKKCGKFVSKGSSLIFCESCPCGYYAILGMKFRSIDPVTREPLSDCSWSFEVKPYEIKNGEIKWEYGNFCIKIERTLGKCGYKKACGYSYEYCEEWNEDYTDCLKSKTEYSNCYEVFVYNLSGFSESMDEFKQVLFSPCGYSGSFPDIWYSYYGSQYLNWEAEDCINSFWRNEFSKKYMLNFSFSYSVLGQNWWQSFCDGFYAMQEECYTFEDGTKECYTFQEHQSGEGGRAYMLAHDGKDSETNSLSVVTGGWYGLGDDCWDSTKPCYHTDCCVYVGTASSIAQTTEHIRSFVEDKTKYAVYPGGWYNGSKGTFSETLNCENSNNLCCDFSYQSGCSDNYYGSMTSAVFNFRWGKFSINRTSLTPEDAMGVELELTFTETKTNTGLNRESSTSATHTAKIQMPFGVPFEELPLATDVNLLGVVESPTCSSDCKSWGEGEWKIQPYVLFGWAGVTPYEQDCKYHTVEVKLKVLDYFK